MRSLVLSPALLVLFANGATAQAQQAAPQPAPKTSAALPSQPSDTVRLTRILGARVDAADGAPAGVLNDVILDKTGDVRAYVVAIAGSRGLGDKNIAIARDALRRTSDQLSADALPTAGIAQPHGLTFRTDLTDKDINSAPDFEPERRPTTAGTMQSTPEPKSSTQSGGPG